MTREEAINFAIHAQSLTDLQEVKEFYALSEAALRKQEERQWIPVEERLPEADGTYLCVWQGRKVDTGFFINGQFRLYGEVKTHLISHWMPMPELPKEG